MALLSRKGLLAIAAVIDVALHGRGGPVSAKVLADGMRCRRDISNQSSKLWCASGS